MPIVVKSLGVGEQYLDYEQTWQQQREIHSQVVSGSAPDQVLLLEHSSVYTAGRRTESSDLPIDGTAVVTVDRGGKITWHGPGQLVGYPILHLPSPLEVVPHVRRLEDVLIGVCSELGLDVARIKGRSGVWISDTRGDRKLAAIGVRVAQGVTMHGFALNCSNQMADFDKIVPCGISDAGVTTLTAELGRTIEPHEILELVTAHLHRVFDEVTAPLPQVVTA